MAQHFCHYIQEKHYTEYDKENTGYYGYYIKMFIDFLKKI